MSKAPFLSVEDLKVNAIAIAISLVLHLVLGWFAFLNIETGPKKAAESVIEVSLEQFAPPVQKTTANRQMVSPSQSKTDKPPPTTSKLSDEDSAVEKEQVRRGDPGVPSPVKGTRADPVKGPEQRKVPVEEKAIQKPEQRHEPREKPAALQPEKPAPEAARQAPQRLTNLKLDSATMLDKFGDVQANEKKSDLTSKITGGSGPTPLKNYRAFSRPSGSGAAFLGTGGVRDFLPGLPDGDITLLNAKASTYAGFVRRVATQVFALMRQSGWDQLVYGDIRSINDFNTVIAVLSPDGRFLRAELKDGSGNSKFDTILVDAAQRGARDPNPPEGAASADGTIRFIFKSRSWAEGGASAQSGAPIERRWLMLATGLE